MFIYLLGGGMSSSPNLFLLSLALSLYWRPTGALNLRSLDKWFIKQTNSWSINQSKKQSVSQSINQLVNQSINQSINQSTNYLIKKSINQSITYIFACFHVSRFCLWRSETVLCFINLSFVWNNIIFIELCLVIV